MKNGNEHPEKGKATAFPDRDKEEVVEDGSLPAGNQCGDIFENFPDGILLADEGVILDCNPAVVELLHAASKNELIGKHLDFFSPPTQPDGRFSAEVTRENWRLALEKKTLRVEWVHRDLSGRDFPVDVSMAMVTRDGKTLCHLVWRDLTEQKKTEKALRRSEARYRYLFENVMMGIFQSSLDGKFLAVNSVLAAIHGFSSPEDMIASVKDVGLQLYLNPAQYRNMMKLLQEQGQVHGLELNLCRKDQDRIWVCLNICVVRDSRGKDIYLQGIVQDITERRGAEEALIREKELFRSLVEESPFGASVIGCDGRYKYINARFSEMFGYTLEDVPSGREWFRKAHPDPDDRHRVIASWMEYLRHNRNEKSAWQSFDVTCKDGTEKSIQFRPVSMESGDFLVMYEDFTERRHLEEQLHQSEKLEAIGTLAGGIAHDFNNLLMGIQGYISILQLSLGTGHREYEKLNRIQSLIQSGSDLAQQLLGFARGGKYEIKPTNINDILTRSSSMFGRTRKDIVLSCDLQECPWMVEVDRSQIEQVLINLYVNAAHAMPGGGTLSLATKNVVMDEAASRSAHMQSGDYVCITVTDTGVGMDEKTRQRIFEPFFTTREMKRGTGLGLASVYGIIQGHGGTIHVSSEKGHGTTFQIYLPAFSKEILKEEKPVAEIARGHETILLVDDEEVNIEVVREILEMLGYKVFTARSGQDAVDLFRDNNALIDLVVLDMIMPGMGGGDTFDALKKIDPAVKVILSSGYSLHGEASRIMERGCSAFIQKPFRIEELSDKLEEVLGKKP